MSSHPTAEPQLPPLRILHWEDNSLDRASIGRALAAGGLACTFTPAVTPREYETALRGGPWDLILSDFTLPPLDGAQALALANELRPDVPFIFVSGAISAERAVESLKNGASDYVPKSSLDRLVPAVLRARREAEERHRRRQVEQALQASVSESKQLEAQLLQTQKMESIGQLAGGVAHDFNNMLTVINGRASLLLDYEANLPPSVIDGLKEIYVAGERAASLTRQLLMFSRQQAVDREPLDLNELIEEVAQMLGRLIGEHLVLDLRLARPLPLIEADSGMMEQILLNLAVNARDAMPGGGRLSIATELRSVSPADLRRQPQARPGDFVCLRVTDTGCGIPPDVMPRIFEPFYTTKAVGQGTGLGLATVFGIVKQHEGWIEVESTADVGTTFQVLLPVAATPAVRRPVSRPPMVTGGKETILLVEDEPSVREFAAAVLQKYGYSVLQAISGVEALEVWKWYAPRIALLVTDIVMPDGLTGIELADKLQHEKPGLPVVLASGYNQETFGQIFKPRPGIRLIYKPFLPRALAVIVREALDSPALIATP